MDIRSFFKPVDTTNIKSNVIQDENDNNVIVNRSINIANQPADSGTQNTGFLDTDSDSTPKTTRLKKKSKVVTQDKSLFDDEDDTDTVSEIVDNKISVRQLCNLENTSSYSRQVNLTEFFDNSNKNTPSTASNSQIIDSAVKKVKSTDFNSYLEQMDLDGNSVKTSANNSNILPDKLLDTQDNETKQISIQNKKFVFTGVLTTIDRDDAIKLVKKLGGFVVSAVSDQIDYLVYGELLEDGRPFKTGTKYKKFCDLNKIRKQRLKFESDAKPLIELVDESTFTKMVNGLSPTKSDNLTHDNTKLTSNINIIENKTTKPIKNVSKVNNSLLHSHTTSSLWVDKYSPRTVDDIISNQLQLKRLKEWLITWKSLNGVNVANSDKKRGKTNFKCALLSGPPGIGKTTSARLIVAACGYSILEFNASDQRNKQAIDQISIIATGGITLGFDNNSLSEDTCIVMDEVDGISGRDRGGSQAIHRMIDKSVCPIICICNDRNMSKIRTLANKCLDLKFTLPSKMLVVQRLKKICQSENIIVNDNILDSLCDSRQCDIRQCINALQFLSNSKTLHINKDTSYVDDIKTGEKDNNLITSAFEIAQRLFFPKNPNDLTFINILDYYFIDYDMVPLMIQENFIKFIKDTLLRNKWSAFCTVADAFVIGDVIHKNIYTKSSFGMLPELGFITTVLPVYVLKSLNSNMSNERLDFPRWLGKLSTSNKNKRLLQEFSIATTGKIGSNSSAFMDGLYKLVYQKVMTKLINGDMNSTIDLMLELGVTRDFLVDGYSSFLLDGEENLYDKLTTKDKSAFTRKYNSQMADITKSTSGKNKSQTDNNDNDNDVDDDDDFINDDDEEYTPRTSGIRKRRATQL